MKLTFTKESVEEYLGFISNVIPSKTSMEILSNILLEAKESELILTGTDLEIGIVVKVKGDIIEPGAITLPAAEFYNIVKNSSESEISLNTLSLNETEITTKNAEYKIKILDAEEYPKIPELADASFISVSESELLTLFEKTSFAASNDEMRPILNGVYFNISKDNMIGVGTDGKRLAYYKKNIEIETVGSNIKQIIPNKTVNELQKILNPKGKRQVKIYMVENKLFFNLDTILIVSKLIDGTFPDYEQVIPKDYEKQVIINKTKLSQRIKEVNIFSGSKMDSMKFSLTSKKLSLSSTKSKGESRGYIDVVYEGEDFETAYNSQYLADLIKKVESDDIIIKFKEPLSSTLIIDNSVKNGEYLNIIMPMRI